MNDTPPTQSASHPTQPPTQSRSKKNRRALSSSGAIRSTLKAEHEIQSSGDQGSFELENAPSPDPVPFMGVIGSVGGVPAAKGKISVIATEDAMIEGEAIRLESKPWNRLDRGLRIRKIRDWVETLIEYPDELRTEIRICLERSIKAGKLNTNSSVEYDTTKRQINRIPALRFVRTGIKGVDDDGDILDGEDDGECDGGDMEMMTTGHEGIPRVFVKETDKTKRRKKT